MIVQNKTIVIYGLLSIVFISLSLMSCSHKDDSEGEPEPPSLEDSDYSSSAATVNARVVDDEDDATSPPPPTACIDTAPSTSAPPSNNDNPAASTPQ